MSNNQTVEIIPADVFAIVADTDTLKGQHAEALKALRKARKDEVSPEEFGRVFSTAATLLRDTTAIRQAREAATAFVQSAKAAEDAHTSYVMAIVGEYIARFPSAPQTEICRAMYGDADAAQRKAVSRYVRAIRFAATAKMHGTPVSAKRSLSLTGQATNAEVKAMTERVRAGETPVAAPVEGPVAVKFGKVAKDVERLLDAVRGGVEFADGDDVAATLGRLQQLADRLSKAAPKATTAA